MKKFYLLLLILLNQLNFAQDGSLQTVFNQTINTTDFGPIAAHGTDVVIAENRYVNGVTVLHKFLSNGQPDPNFSSLQILPFNLTGTLNTIHSLYVETNGNILVGGLFGRYGMNNRNNLFRVSETGVIDPTFIPQLPPDFAVFDIIIQQGVSGPNNLLVVGATQGLSNKFMYRLNSVTGAIDTTFNQQGPNYNVNSISTFSNGEIIISGPFTQVDGQNISHIAKLDTNGFPLSGFSIDPQLIVTAIGKVVVQNNNHILIGGKFKIGSTSSQDRYILRLNSNGTIDSGFLGTIFTSNTMYGGVFDIDIDLNGKILIAGNFDQVNGIQRNHIAKLCGVDGSLDIAFDPGLGPQHNNPIIGIMSIDSNNDVFINGQFTQYNGTPRNSLAKVINSNAGPGIVNAVDNIGNIWGSGGLATGNVLNNDTVNGTPANFSSVVLTQVSSSHPNISLNTTTGFTIVQSGTQAGVYTLVYKICSISSPCDCDTATITVNIYATQPIANDDTGTILGTGGGTAIADVLANDDYGNFPPTTSEVTLTQISTTNPGVQLNITTGAVNVAPGTPSGLYSLVYQICDPVNTTICDTATVSITVTEATAEPPTVIAEDDIATIDCLTTVAITNVLANDGYGFGRIRTATLSTVTLTLVSSSNPGITLNTATGAINVAPGILPGIYTLVYEICAISDPRVCDTATVTVTVEPCFNPGTGANSYVFAVALQDDGKIIIGGTFTTYNGQPRNRIARLNSDLSLDPTFDPNGIGFNDAVFSLDIQDGNVIVGGRFTATSTGTLVNKVARLNSFGNLDVNFVNNTYQTILTSGIDIRCVKVQPNGQILVGGNFTGINSSPNFTKANILRLNYNGDVDSNFNSVIIDAFGSVEDIYILEDSSILVGGYSLKIDNSPIKILYKITSNGQLHPNFIITTIAQQQGFNNNVRSIKIVDNKIIVAGSFSSYGANGTRNIARLSLTGVPDNLSDFNPNLSSNEQINSLEIEPLSNKIIIGGKFTLFNGNSAQHLARLNTDGSFDSTFNIGTGFQLVAGGSSVSPIKIQPDGKLIIGGFFTLYNGNNAKYITRLVPNTNPIVQGRNTYPVIEMDIIPEFNDQVFSGNNEFNIYPNPSTGIFNLNLSGYENEKFELTVFNPLGQLIYQNTVSQDTVNQIDLSSFESGNYFVRLQNNQRTINKIIVKK